MKKIVLLLGSVVLLNSCIVASVASAATSVAVGATKLAVKGVSATVKSIGWAYTKANGKINEDRLKGTWKIVAFYNGTYDEFVKDKEGKNLIGNPCKDATAGIIFNTKKETFTNLKCGAENANPQKYLYSFEKNKATGDYENILMYGVDDRFTIINLERKKLVLEGSIATDGGVNTKGVYMLEQID